jgi:hypothetical protein
VQAPSAIPVIFYRTAQGGEPVREWLRTLPIEDRRAIGRDLAVVQYGWPVACRFVDRWVEGFGKSGAICGAGASPASFSSCTKARLASCTGFIKKTQRTPPDDLALAHRRMQEMMS